SAEQVERTYWTEEFGISRWEKWARDDWINARSGKSARELAEALFRSGDCGNPYVVPATISAHLAIRPVAIRGVYASALDQPGLTGAHTWYMTLCADYTNIVPDKNASGTMPQWGDRISPAYWSQ